jgi:hypothetical protein
MLYDPVMSDGLKKYHFYLFSDALIYGYRSGYLANKKMEINQTCHLLGAKVNAVKTSKIKNGFEFMSTEKSFAVVTNSQEEAITWVQAIQKQIDNTGGEWGATKSKVALAKMHVSVGSTSGSSGSNFSPRETTIGRFSSSDSIRNTRGTSVGDSTGPPSSSYEARPSSLSINEALSVRLYPVIFIISLSSSFT